MPPLVEAGPTFTRIGVTASAFYGEGGVRLLAAPNSRGRPVRGKGPLGMAHLSFGASGLGSHDRRDHSCGVEPGRHARSVFGVGGGVLMRGGPLQLRSRLSLQSHHGEQRAELDPEHRTGTTVASGAFWSWSALLTVSQKIRRPKDQKFLHHVLLILIF